MYNCVENDVEKLKRCEWILKENMKKPYGTKDSSSLKPIFSSVGSSNFHRICDGHLDENSDESMAFDKTNSLPDICDKKIVGSLEAQLEFLRHELLLSKNQIEDRNAQLEKLETIVNNQTDVMKHNCEGSSSLSKVIQLMHGAVQLQNQQIANLSSLERRIKALEKPCISQLCFASEHSKNSNLCKVQRLTKAPDGCTTFKSILKPQNDTPSEDRLLNKKHVTIRNEATQCDEGCAIPTRLQSRPVIHVTSIDKTTDTSEVPLLKQSVDIGTFNEMQDRLEGELEKLNRINRQLNENTRTLQDQIQSLQTKLETVEREKSAALQSLKCSNDEIDDLQRQLKSLAEQNSKFNCNMRKLDEERDLLIKELDCADEVNATLKSQLQKADERGSCFEAQYNSSVEQNRKLQELLRTSEGIVENLKKQKLDLSKEIGEANGKLEDLQKSYDTLRIRLHHSLKQLKKIKKDFVKANEEKTVLQSQLQDYVSKVRGIEDLLLQKEQEREFMFEQFREMTERSKGILTRSDINPRSDTEENDVHCDDWQSVVNPLSEEEESSLENYNLSKVQKTLYKSDAEIQTNLGFQPPERFVEELNNSTREAMELEAALNHEKKTSEKLHDIIKATREEAIEANMKNEQLTLQLEAMRMTVQQLESQVKTIAKSMVSCRRECMEQVTQSQKSIHEESGAFNERQHYTRSESSQSTML